MITEIPQDTWEKRISENYGSFKYCREVDKKGHDALIEDVRTELQLQRKEDMEEVRKLVDSFWTSYMEDAGHNEVVAIEKEEITELLTKLSIGATK